MKGLDIGTSSLISAKEVKKGTDFKLIRDAFFRIFPSTPMAAMMIEKGLAGKSYFKQDGVFIVIGQDAIDKAVERNSSALRPLQRGIVSPKEKDSFSVLRHIIEKLLGKPSEAGEAVVYSVPAQPIDQSSEQFDVGYHESVFGSFITTLGYKAISLNEAEAICYSELMDDDLTGISLSAGAGMCNVCLMSGGEAILRLSLVRSGDWIDRMVAQALRLEDSEVQVEKESGDINIDIDDATLNALPPIHKAICIYYKRLIDYFWANLSQYLKTKQGGLPKFKDPIPLVVAGGTSQMKGFVSLLEKSKPADFPLVIREVRHANNPLYAVAKGCLLYAGV